MQGEWDGEAGVGSPKVNNSIKAVTQSEKLVLPKSTVPLVNVIVILLLVHFY